MNNSCAIFTNSNTDVLSSLYKYFKSNYSDIFFITENSELALDNHYALMYSFYLKFHADTIVFTNIEDYIYNKDNLSSKNIYVLTTLDEIITQNLDKSYLKNIKIISIENGDVKVS